jgi:adenylate cyclase class 2
VARSPDNREIEIKLRAPGPSAAAELLTTHGFTLSKPRVFERNAVFDTPAQDLRSSNRLLRVRQAGEQCKLTFKGAPEPGRHKSREELELDLGDAHTFELILTRLGYQRTFIYEKYRTEFQDDEADGVATLDETPIGTFLELEGPAAWIDATAARLGFPESDYITSSYGRLYLDWCRDRGTVPGDMVFQ